MVLIKDTLIFLRPDIKSGLCLWKKNNNNNKGDPENAEDRSRTTKNAEQRPKTLATTKAMETRTAKKQKA